MNNPEVSSTSLKALAMELGASLELPDGKVFNAGGNKGQFKHPQKQKPAADYTQQLLTKLVEAAARPATATAVEPPKVDVKVEAAKPVSWKFSFVRNADGTIQDIIAKPL